MHARARAALQVLWVEPVAGEGGAPPAWSGPEFAGGRVPRVALPARDFDELVRPSFACPRVCPPMSRGPLV
jgi:hypothetical protein